MKKLFCFCLITLLTCFIFSQESSTSSMNSQSFIDWTKKEFSSAISFNIKNSGISFPSGRSIAHQEIQKNLPLLIKNPLLTLPLDSSSILGDLIVRQNISLEQIVKIIDDGYRSPSYFSSSLEELNLNHNIDIQDIARLLIMHNAPYMPITPIEKVASREYTGIVIDCRGSLPVHGEFSTDTAEPCIFPKIWDENMNLIYERNMVQPLFAKENGIVTYSYTENESEYKDIIGKTPLRISARKIFGVQRTDPVISNKDALKILSILENRRLLEEGRVVFLLDKDALVHPVTAPLKDKEYYVTYRDVEDFYYERKIPDVVISDGPKGMLISIENLKFIADSSELLPDEDKRLDDIALTLKEATKNGGFTILVEGHTASVGKPTGEMNLSIERSKTIIDEMTKRGINPELFSYKGYGGTAPLADNSTNEGRAANRRVEINVIPQQTYIQRIP